MSCIKLYTDRDRDRVNDLAVTVLQVILGEVRAMCAKSKFGELKHSVDVYKAREELGI